MPSRPSFVQVRNCTGSGTINAHEKVRRRAIIPEPIREETISFAKLLVEFFGPAFAANSRLKFSVGKLLMSQLPPLPRPCGRPGYEQVTKAIRAREEARRLHPERSQKQIWREVYPAVIPNYHSLPPPERRDAQDWLRQRVHWRLSARRRRQRMKTQH